jgi:hypothetical protein
MALTQLLGRNPGILPNRQREHFDRFAEKYATVPLSGGRIQTRPNRLYAHAQDDFV